MSQFNNTSVLLKYMCVVKQYGEMVSQVGTSLNPVHFFKSVHSLAIEVKPSA